MKLTREYGKYIAQSIKELKKKPRRIPYQYVEWEFNGVDREYVVIIQVKLRKRKPKDAK